MIDRKKQKYILSKTKKLNKEIANIYDEYLDELSVILTNYYNNTTIDTFDTFSEKLYDKIIEMLEKVYSLTSSEIKNIYKIKRQLPISKIETYSKDGYDLKARLSRWFNSENNLDYISDKIAAITKLKEILITECLYQKQVVMNDKLKDFCDFAIIEESPDCHSGICNEYAGEWPINELIYPPYHPNCQCEVIYEVSDDIEDVEDLDLEDDLNEEYYE